MKRRPLLKRDVVEALFHNGVTQWFSEAHLKLVLRKHFKKDEMALIGKTCPEAYRLWRSSRGIYRAIEHISRPLLSSLRRSGSC